MRMSSGFAFLLELNLKLKCQITGGVHFFVKHLYAASHQSVGASHTLKCLILYIGLIRALPAAVPAGSSCGKFVSEFPSSGAYYESCQLLSTVIPSLAINTSTFYVVCIGLFCFVSVIQWT